MEDSEDSLHTADLVEESPADDGFDRLGVQPPARSRYRPSEHWADRWLKLNHG